MRVIFNNGQFELDCIGMSYGYGPIQNSHGGYVMRVPELFLALEFKGNIPDVLHRIAKTSYIIDNITFCADENYPLGLEFLYVIIIRADTKNGKTNVYMSALRMGGSNKSQFGKIKRKFCITCGRNIHYNYVVNGMSGWVNPHTIYNLWNNELIDFYCCVCYKKQELIKNKKEKEGKLCLIQ